ncbi:MAG: Tm-1-like ATP-binding domain-containing protein [Moorellales bacterium]
MKAVVLIGTLDTKGEQLDYLREGIRARGHRVILMDVSMKEASCYPAEVPAEEIARAAGEDIAALRASAERFRVTEAMTRGAIIKAQELVRQGSLDAVVAYGGTTLALLGARVMHSLPFGIPKIIAVPAAMPTYIKEWFGAADLVVMQMLFEAAGSNPMLLYLLDQVAGMVSGMVEESRERTDLRLPFPSAAITEMGFCTRCAREVERLLKERGYEVCSFHAQGISDRAMDQLIGQGFFDALIDIVPAGLIEEVLKGNRAAGMDRLRAPLERGIPVVLAPCCLNLTGCGPTRPDRERFASRSRIMEIDALRSMTRLNREELEMCARLYAERLNLARGPVRFLIPTRGWSSLDREGTVLYDPAEDRIFVEELLRHLRPEIEVREVDANLEDPAFARALVDSAVELLGAGAAVAVG